MPTVVQILNGEKPANTAPVRVDTTPGAIERYSGGGTTVMQQLLVDVTGTPLPGDFLPVFRIPRRTRFPERGRHRQWSPGDPRGAFGEPMSSPAVWRMSVPAPELSSVMAVPSESRNCAVPAASAGNGGGGGGESPSPP